VGGRVAALAARVRGGGVGGGRGGGGGGGVGGGGGGGGVLRECAVVAPVCDRTVPSWGTLSLYKIFVHF